MLVCVRYQNLGNANYSCQVQCMYVHVMTPGKRPRTAKSCRGGTRVPDALIGTNQLRETTLTENPRSPKVAGVERRASNPASEKLYR